MKLALTWPERLVRVGLGLLVPVALVLLFRLGSSLFASAQEEAERVGRTCDPSRIESSCGSSEVCLGGRCGRFIRPSRCAAGEAPRGCTCAPGHEVHLGRCRPVEELKLVPEACAVASVWEVVLSLQRSCARTSGADDAPISACSAEEWGQMSRESPYLDISLLTLPGVVTVHFPVGEPSSQVKPAVEDGYRDALARHLAELRRARIIFIIGRASRRGDPELNEQLALRRATFARELLRTLLGEELPQTLVWGLASDVLVAPASFKAQRALGAGVGGPIAWSEAAEERLREALHPDTDLQMLDADEVAWVQDALNRAAFVVPIYCEGTEFNPPAAFQGAGIPGERRG